MPKSGGTAYPRRGIAATRQGAQGVRRVAEKYKKNNFVRKYLDVRLYPLYNKKKKEVIL